MGRLLIWVSLASLVLVSLAAGWMAWRAGAQLPMRRRAALAALAGALAALPGSALAYAVYRAARGLRGAAPRAWNDAAESLAWHAAGALLESGAPSCAR